VVEVRNADPSNAVDGLEGIRNRVGSRGKKKNVKAKEKEKEKEKVLIIETKKPVD
jgi:hypothetical protein